MNRAKPRFQWRALTSVLITACFLLLLLSGGMLFVSPPGRIANWTNWTILRLTKHEWTHVHIWFSTIFLIATIAHLVFNWRPLVSYFKNKLTQHLGFRWEWLIALLLAGGVFAGTLAGITPFASLLAFNEQIKNSWDAPADRAPIPHAELLTLAELAEKANVELAVAETRLRAAGIRNFTSGSIMAKIAEANQTSGLQLYQLILASQAIGSGVPGSKAGPGNRGGQSGGGGMGWKTLTEYCAEEGIGVAEALARLKAKGIEASEQLTLREIASKNGYNRPFELLGIIRGSAATE